MRKTIAAMLALVAILITCGAGFRQWTARQEELHAAADALRELGYTDDGAAIQALQSAWRDEESNMQWVAVSEGTPDEPPLESAPEAVYEGVADSLPHEVYNINHGTEWTWTDFCSVCATCAGEYGACPDEIQYIGACEILNRCEYWEFPDTPTGVISQPGQYDAGYIVGDLTGVSDEVVDAVARAFTETERTTPADVMYHASGRSHHRLPLWKEFSGTTWAGFSWVLRFYHG